MQLQLLYLYLLIFRLLGSPVPSPFAASPTFDPLRPPEVRWVQTDRFHRQKTKSDIYPILSSQRVRARYSARAAMIPIARLRFSKGSKQACFIPLAKLGGISNVTLKRVVSSNITRSEILTSVAFSLSPVIYLGPLEITNRWLIEK